jgi:hypothetical protein
VKFIILCYPRTGSTLLITALGAHPNIKQGMEIFNPEQEGNDPWVHWRKATFKALYGGHDSYLNADGNLDGNRFDLSLLAIVFFKAFDATKIMYDQLDRRSKVWDYLRSLDDLRVIVLRRNFVEAAVSFSDCHGDEHLVRAERKIVHLVRRPRIDSAVAGFDLSPLVF